MHWRNPWISCGTLLIVVMGVALVVLGPSLGSAQTLPTLPQVYVDTTMPAITGNTYTVNAGGNFQTTLNQAAAADPNLNHLIVLQAGATFSGPFKLPARAAGNGWIVIRSSAISSLPGEGTRVGPANGPNMAKLVSSTPPYLLTSSPNAHHYRFVGIELTAGAGTFLGAIVNIGTANSLSQLEHHIIFDRVYVHGDPTRGANKGLAASGNYIAVVDSYVTDCKDPGNGDTNAIWVFNSTGPIKIINNYLAGGGENVMFGGAVPYISGVIPSDVEIRGNYVVKPASWAGVYAQKNLIEWKHGKRFLVDSNIFENQLVCGQAYGIMLTPRASDTGNWAEASDITFTNNIFRNACGGFAASGRESTVQPYSQNILVRNNLFYNLGTAAGDGHFAFLANGIRNVTFDHNTIIQNGKLIYSDSSSENNPNFTYTNNIAPHNAYGVFVGGVGTYSLNAFFSPYTFTKNVIYDLPAGIAASQYPANNFFPTGSEVGFTNFGAGDFRLTSSSPYKNGATDGKDIGADIDALNAATAGVIQGKWGSGGSEGTNPPGAPTALTAG